MYIFYIKQTHKYVINNSKASIILNQICLHTITYNIILFVCKSNSYYIFVFEG